MATLPPFTPTAKCWRGREMERRSNEWLWHWDRSELDALLDAAARLEAPESALTAELPRSVASLGDRVRRQLLDGPGFVLLRGLDVDAHPLATIGTAYLLLGRAIGSLRSQNAAGHLLGHVIDVGADPTDPTARIYQTHERQTFHTDSSDCVGLLCLKTARSGGESMLVSAEAIYEEMVATSPELAARLFDIVATDRRGEIPPGMKPWFEIPVLNLDDGLLTVLYQRQYVAAAQRFDGAPKLDDEQIAALDRFDELANDPAMRLEMEFRPGDIQFVHNHGLLHDRLGFEDHDDPTRRRHLLRLWLSLPGDRRLPQSFTQRYGSIEIGDRGGIEVSGTTRTVSLSP